MNRRLSTLAAAAAVACAGAFAALPAHAGNVSWGVSIGVPGLGLYAGAPSYGWGYRPYARPYAYAPSYYAPAPAYYAPPRVVYPAPYHHRPAYRPYAYRAPVYPAPVYRPYGSSY